MIDLYRYDRIYLQFYITAFVSFLGLCLRINVWFVCLDYSDCSVSDLFYVPPGMTVLPSVRPSGLWGTTLRAAPSKNYAFSTNYYACIAMPTWPRCAPPILCWPWPPYNLFPRSSLTWMFSSILTDGYNFACSAQQNLYLFNKWSCMHCTTNMT